MKCGLNKQVIKEIVDGCNSMGVNVNMQFSSVYDMLDTVYAPIIAEIAKLVFDESISKEDRNIRVFKLIALSPHMVIDNRGELTVLGSDVHVIIHENNIYPNCFLIVLLFANTYVFASWSAAHVRAVLRQYLEWTLRAEPEIERNIDVFVLALRDLIDAYKSGEINAPA